MIKPAGVRRLVTTTLVLVLLASGIALFWYATRPPAPNSQPVILGNVGDATGFARAGRSAIRGR
jgi:hypothetical protein